MAHRHTTARPCLALTIMLMLTTATPRAWAFHEQGVARCNGCHTMHISHDGRPLYHWNPTGNEHLLMYGNASDTCLMCHSWYYGQGYSAGGDFYWLRPTFTWASHGETVSSTGDSHGHNVVTGFFHIEQDAVNTTAPGGTFESRYMSCTSCHDPHGNANFRMLYGAGDGPYYDGGRFPFNQDSPLAVGLDPYAVRPGTPGEETNASHTVYKSGMSDWCANCHPDLHSAMSTGFRHPTGEALGSGVSAAYNAYVSTVDPTGGDPAIAYMGLVPFENVGIDLSQVDPSNHTAGALPSDQVMCLTCHRAHASPFRDAARWDFSATFLNEDSHPQITDAGASAGDVANRYYGYTFVPGQRSLCNKCHVKDLGDEMP